MKTRSVHLFKRNFDCTCAMFGFRWLEDSFLSKTTCGATCAIEAGGFEAVPLFGYAINGVNPNTDNGAGSSLLLTLGYAPQAGQAFTLLNNTSATAVGARFACGDRTSATYGGEAYPFSINYAGRDGAGLVLAALSTPRGILIKFY
jgi:hypothetical protein